MRVRVITGLVTVVASLSLACSEGSEKSGGEMPAEKVAEAAPPEKPAAPQAPADKAPPPVQQALEGQDLPTLVLSQAWFYKDINNKSVPGPARLEFWRKGPSGWTSSRLEDGDSNVFHKAVLVDGGLLTIGAEKAMLKRWAFANGTWTQQTLWQRQWEGKFNRLRDLEIGDVDGDGKDEYVIATHDHGVVAVLSPDEPNNVVELDPTADTFVHEIEIGDIDGDGKKEFFATPSGRNTAQGSQSGMLVMYRWDGKSYQRSIVESFSATHAKECLVADLDGDGVSEIFAVLEAELGLGNTMLKPVTIRQYLPAKGGTFTSRDVATIQDRQTRFLVPFDVDGDGTQEIIASAMKSGVWMLKRQADGSFATTSVDPNSGGFEHATLVTDLEGDGKKEMYIVADDQAELKRYDWNTTRGAFDITKVADLEKGTLTWGMAGGRM